MNFYYKKILKVLNFYTEADINNKKIGNGAVIGIVVGALLAAILISIIGLTVMKKQRIILIKLPIIDSIFFKETLGHVRYQKETQLTSLASIKNPNYSDK